MPRSLQRPKDNALPHLLREALLRSVRGNQPSLTLRELAVLLVISTILDLHPLHELVPGST